MNHLPVVVIGAGPIGLAAAAHLYERNMDFVILEKGASAGNNILEWGHVQLFSPWEYNMDHIAKKLLHTTDWNEPNPEELPTGNELVENYLEPLSNLKQFSGKIIYHAEVTAITRKNRDKMKTEVRENTPFVIYYKSNGLLEKTEARAVIDASGTWNNPNPPFADGVWRNQELIHHLETTIPNVKKEAAKYKNKHVVVVGSGHSALNTLIDLTNLKEQFQNTEISWIIRKQQVQETFGGEENDALSARGELGTKTHNIIENGIVNVYAGFYIEDILLENNTFQIQSSEGATIQDVDEIIVNTGARPNLSFLNELRIELDPIVESTVKLAPLIDPNLHSCGTVRPHGEKELRHPEAEFYIAGVKSYGRAPTFLMATGYEQVRSIIAYLSGDVEAAERVQLKLPQTGVCKATPTPKQLQIIGMNDEGCAGDGCGC
jgi:thioredoxin reductase